MRLYKSLANKTKVRTDILDILSRSGIPKVFIDLRQYLLDADESMKKPCAGLSRNIGNTSIPKIQREERICQRTDRHANLIAHDRLEEFSHMPRPLCDRIVLGKLLKMRLGNLKRLKNTPLHYAL